MPVSSAVFVYIKSRGMHRGSNAAVLRCGYLSGKSKHLPAGYNKQNLRRPSIISSSTTFSAPKNSSAATSILCGKFRVILQIRITPPNGKFATTAHGFGHLLGHFFHFLVRFGPPRFVHGPESAFHFYFVRNNIGSAIGNYFTKR